MNEDTSIVVRESKSSSISMKIFILMMIFILILYFLSPIILIALNNKFPGIIEPLEPYLPFLLFPLTYLYENIGFFTEFYNHGFGWANSI